MIDSRVEEWAARNKGIFEDLTEPQKEILGELVDMALQMEQKLDDVL